MKKRFQRREKGQAMVEFALLLPMLLLLVCGIIDFAWLSYSQLALNNACREAARYAIVHSTDSGIQEAVQGKVNSEAPDIYPGGIVVKLVYDDEDLTVFCSANMNIFTPVLGTINGSQTKLLSTSVTMMIEDDD